MMMVYEIEVEHATGRARVLEARSRQRPEMGGVPSFTASRWYDTRAEAEALRDWLMEREAGYPPNPILVDSPQW